MAVGYNRDGRCDVSDWSDIVAVSAGRWHTVGLKDDGTASATSVIGHTLWLSVREVLIQ